MRQKRREKELSFLSRGGYDGIHIYMWLPRSRKRQGNENYPCQDRIVLAVIQIRLNSLARTKVFLERVISRKKGEGDRSLFHSTSAFEDLRGPFERQKAEIVLSFGETFAHEGFSLSDSFPGRVATGCEHPRPFLANNTSCKSLLRVSSLVSLRQINFNSFPEEFNPG